MWNGFKRKEKQLIETSKINRDMKKLILSILSITILGFSARQGGHQEAQKSTKTNLPSNELNLISFPAIDFATIFGSLSPIS